MTHLPDAPHLIITHFTLTDFPPSKNQINKYYKRQVFFPDQKITMPTRKSYNPTPSSAGLRAPAHLAMVGKTRPPKLGLQSLKRQAFIYYLFMGGAGVRCKLADTPALCSIALCCTEHISQGGRQRGSGACPRHHASDC